MAFAKAINVRFFSIEGRKYILSGTSSLKINESDFLFLKRPVDKKALNSFKNLPDFLGDLPLLSDLNCLKSPDSFQSPFSLDFLLTKMFPKRNKKCMLYI